MKKYAMFLLASALTMSVTVFAQEQTAPPRQEKMRTEKRVEFRQKHKGIVTPQMRADKMAKELGLSDAEKAKVKTLIEKNDQLRIQRADEMQKMRKDFKAKIEKDRDAQKAELEKIIGKEKFDKLQAMRAEKAEKMKSMMKERMHDRMKMRDGKPGMMQDDKGSNQNMQM